MNKSQLQKVYNYKRYPRDSKILTDKGFINIDNGSRGGSHWCAFYMQNNKSFYFDSFEGRSDNILLNHSPKPILYHKY